jgi:hypothetical protein
VRDVQASRADVCGAPDTPSGVGSDKGAT